MGTKANCKIEIYDTAGDLDQTLTTDIMECSFTDVFTTDVGSFTFKVPAMKDFSNLYDDIGNNYKAKLFFGYDNTFTHLFTGKITDFQTLAGKEATRVFEGKGLGEILERIQKKNTRWQETDASAIAAELAVDLDLTADIDEDLTEITVAINTESYFDILRKVSDYWYDADTQVKKDFGINKNGTLFWKNRPMRTVDVETISNILNYTLKYAILSSKNNVTILGAANTFYPTTQELFTEDSLDGWTSSVGTLELSTDHQVGDKSVRLYNNSGSAGTATLTFPQKVHLRDINTLFFKYKPVTGLSGCQIHLLAPDTSNYFLANLTNNSSWNDFNEKLGEENEYSGLTGAGVWHSGAGHPNWWNIQGIKFVSNTNPICIDNLYFSPDRQVGTAADATNIAVYGQRDVEYTDDKLSTAAECTQRAETILYQQKDRIQRLDFVVPGNTNILLGDRLTITLPLDNIIEQSFDVVSVTHTFSGKPVGYQTAVSALNTVNTRRMPPLTPLDSIRLNLKGTKDVIGEIYSRIVK